MKKHYCPECGNDIRLVAGCPRNLVACTKCDWWWFASIQDEFDLMED